MSKVGNRIYTNFLRIELNADVPAIVQDIVDTFLSYNGSDRIIISHKRDEKGRFLYKGFYRQIFNLLLLQKSVMCRLLIDLTHGTLSFPEIDLTLSGLHRKEKALYTLFVFEAANMAIRDEHGNVKQNGGINFTPPASAKMIPKFDQRMELLQRRYARIYGAFGGDPLQAPDITKSAIRLPMLTGIRRAISRHSEKIYDADRFIINRDKNGFYGLTALPDMFLCRDLQNPEPVNAFDSPLFKELSKLK